MQSRSTSWMSIVLGVVALAIGGLWIGQGLGFIPGSFMTGDPTWFYIGLVVAVVGIVLIASALARRRRPTR